MTPHEIESLSFTDLMAEARVGVNIAALLEAVVNESVKAFMEWPDDHPVRLATEVRTVLLPDAHRAGEAIATTLAQVLIESMQSEMS